VTPDERKAERAKIRRSIRVAGWLLAAWVALTAPAAVLTAIDAPAVFRVAVIGLAVSAGLWATLAFLAQRAVLRSYEQQDKLFDVIDVYDAALKQQARGLRMMAEAGDGVVLIRVVGAQDDEPPEKLH
jgi:hypothetical protein